MTNFLSEVHAGRCPSGAGTWTTSIRLLSQTKVNVDEDGDYSFDELCWKVKHQRETHLDRVGSQIWRGSCLLADFIMSQPKSFENKTVVELGCGVGVVGLSLSNIARKAYLTDHNHEALALCRENLGRNLNNPQTQYHIRMLDWAKDDDFISQLSQGKIPQEETSSLQDFDWKKYDVVDLHSVDIVLAADVIYDETLTEHFFAQLCTIMNLSTNDPVCYVSLEKRWNFTLADLDVSAPAFQHYLSFIDHGKESDPSKPFIGEQIPVKSIPKSIDVERSNDEELWMLKRKPL